MKTIKNGQFLSAESIISIHFNDQYSPSKIQYTFEYEGKKIFLAEYWCDVNALTDVQDLAIDGEWKSDSEHFFSHYYNVVNSKLGTPFDDDMIPNKQFHL